MASDLLCVFCSVAGVQFIVGLADGVKSRAVCTQERLPRKTATQQESLRL